MLSAVAIPASATHKLFSVQEVEDQLDQMLVRQRQCGILALRRCFAMMDVPCDYQQLSSEFETFNQDGVTFSEIVGVARQRAVPARMRALTFGDLMKTKQFPVIALTDNSSHVVVVEHIDKGESIRIWEPTSMSQTWVARDRFAKRYCGAAISFDGSRRQWYSAVIVTLAVTGLVALALRAQWVRYRFGGRTGV